MALVEVESKDDFDRTWFKAGVLAPLEAAHRIVTAFPADVDELSIEELSRLTGRSADDVRGLVPVLVVRKLVNPVQEASGTKNTQIRLHLTAQGEELRDEAVAAPSSD
jgi:hypothetical protein